MKFNGYFDWMYENELAAPISYGCVMLFAEVPNWDKHLAMIDPEDIYGVPGKALEHSPHVTLAYGLHLDKVNPKDVKRMMQTFFPVKVSIKKLTFFNTPDCDVVKYDVPKTKEIKTWHEELLARFRNTQEFDKYEPHVTVAYVNKGTGHKYIKEYEEPFHIIFNRAEYSYTDNEKDNIVVKLDEV
jgi:hypothetical protein